jgi:hypothetical protein
MVFPFARHVSERGHGHPDGFRFKVKLKTERVAIAFRFVLAYAFVRPESEQNSSHLQIDCDRGRNFFPTTPMDFAAWIEVYLGGRWHAFDPGAPGLSLQIEELQGDFDRMQGGPKLGPAKSDQISIVWTASPYSRSREDIIFSREDHLGTGRRRSVLQSNANVGLVGEALQVAVGRTKSATRLQRVGGLALFPARNFLL